MSVLVVQRGHVPRTRGSTGTAGEQQLVKQVAAHVAAQVDTVPGWELRVIDADEPTARYAGDVFVAVHADGSVHPTAHGASVGYRTEAGRRLAHRWKDAYAEAGWPGGFRADNYTAALAGYYGLGRAAGAGTPQACIIECGFLTNPAEAAWLLAHPNVPAAAIVKAATGRWPGAGAPSAPTSTPAPIRPEEDEMLLTEDSAGGKKRPVVELYQRGLQAFAASTGRADPLPRYGADGYYGGETTKAVAAYQRAAGIVDLVPQVGAIDPFTAALLGRYTTAYHPE